MNIVERQGEAEVEILQSHIKHNNKSNASESPKTFSFLCTALRVFPGIFASHHSVRITTRTKTLRQLESGVFTNQNKA